MSRSELIDIDLIVFFETERAYKVGVDDEDRNLKDIWLPKSQVEADNTGRTSLRNKPIMTFTMPRWLAEEKALEDGAN